MKLRIISSLFLVFAFCQNVLAYPIPPVPLRTLIIGSDAIVSAQVLKVERIEGDHDWTDSKATLQIKEMLKGEIKSKTIFVYFSASMTCPAPADYQVGKTVLAFLNKMTKRKNSFYTPTLSYGTKYLKDQEWKIYKQRITELLEIQSLVNEDAKIKLTIDWLIKCAHEPILSWDGLHDLSSESSFMADYDKDCNEYTLKYKLTERQSIEVRKLLFSTAERTGYIELGLVDLVMKENDKELMDFLVKQFKLEGSDMHYWGKMEFMRKIVKCGNRKDLNPIIAKMEILDYSDDDMEEKEKQLVKEFIGKI